MEVRAAFRWVIPMTHDRASDQDGPQPGPSWANPGWLASVVDSDADLTQALDPTTMKLAVKAAAKAAGKAVRSQGGGSGGERFHSCHAAGAAVSCARASGGRSRSAGPGAARNARRPDAGMARLCRTAGPAKSLSAACSASNGSRSRELFDVLRAHLLRQCRPGIHAHRRHRGTALSAGQVREPRRHHPVHAGRQARHPEGGDPRARNTKISSARNMSAPSGSGSTAANR